MERDIKKLIVVLGPTASGKSDLAVKIALRLGSGQARKEYGIKGAEIVSADSRQVYKGMDIGSGKITPDTKNSSNFSTGQAKKKYIFTHKGIPHYCIDVASPKRRFTVAQFQGLARKAIKDIWKRGKIPILCGGTGLYIQSIVGGLVIPKVPPDAKLRAKLEKLGTDELFKRLKKLDSRRAKNIDRHNRRRLVRALEIVIKTGKPVPQLCENGSRNITRAVLENINTLQLGIAQPKEKLKTRIKKRLFGRLRQGMVAEVKRLHDLGISWKRLEEFGLEYRYVARYLQKKLTKPEMIEQLEKEINRYAKRQMTWFSAHGARLPRPTCLRSQVGGPMTGTVGQESASDGKRDKRIKWIKNYKDAERLTRQFLS